MAMISGANTIRLPSMFSVLSHLEKLEAIFFKPSFARQAPITASQITPSVYRANAADKKSKQYKNLEGCLECDNSKYKATGTIGAKYIMSAVAERAASVTKGMVATVRVAIQLINGPNHIRAIL